MKRILIISVITLAVLVLLVTAAFACGDKKTDAQKTSTDKKVSSVNVAASCDDTDKPAATAHADGHSDCVLRLMSVKGMTCTGCEETISAELIKVEGVVEVVKVCHKSGQAMVKVDANADIDAELTKAINSKGYQAEIIPAVAKTVEGQSKGPVCPLSGGPGCAAPDDTAAQKKVENKDKESK
ncbi:MAG: cation transporter [Candidatus Zixiibacteriota bacterium]|nr:MAG: cation transporter [candidate division Zixibacteria bacterium]